LGRDDDDGWLMETAAARFQHSTLSFMGFLGQQLGD
jgi:hypothetical protein